MDYIRSSLKQFCPVMGKVETVYYRMIRERSLVYCPGCEDYKDSPACRRCVEKITQRLTATLASNGDRNPVETK
ncbi:MAG: hypothetical protein II272_02500 [Oscillospiraceae bacterium]|jgi:hypothetical protein|nr:hypothetical protein [Oscillospiraceae bacterium]